MAGNDVVRDGGEAAPAAYDTVARRYLIFASRVPVVKDIATTILLAVGWALLIGNLAYRALRSMASGVGIEAEEPGRLFLRTAMFSFSACVSRQICDIALSLSAVIMRMLEVPKAVTFTPFNEDFFSELAKRGLVDGHRSQCVYPVADHQAVLRGRGAICHSMRTYLLRAAGICNGRFEKHRRDFPRLAENVCIYVYAHGAECDVRENAAVRHVHSPTGVAIVPWIMLITGIVRVAKKDGQHYPAYRTQSGYHRRPAGASSRSGYAQCHAGASRGIVYQKTRSRIRRTHQYGCGSAVRLVGLWYGQTSR